MVRPHARRPDVRLIRALARVSRSGSDLRFESGKQAGKARKADDIELRRMPASFSADLPTKPPCGLSLGGSDAVRPMASNGFADLLPRRVPRLPREARSSAIAVLRCAAALRVQAGRPSPLDRHRGRIGWLRGKVRRNDNGSDRHVHSRRRWLRSYTGTIKTLSTERPILHPAMIAP